MLLLSFLAFLQHISDQKQKLICHLFLRGMNVVKKEEEDQWKKWTATWNNLFKSQNP